MIQAWVNSNWKSPGALTAKLFKPDPDDFISHGRETLDFFDRSVDVLFSGPVQQHDDIDLIFLVRMF